MAKTKPIPTIHLTLQGKGGVGKSLVSSILAQYLRARSRDLVCVDTDPVNRTLAGFEALDCRTLDLMTEPTKLDVRQFDVLMEQLLTEPTDFVVDNGASSFVPLWGYMIESGALAMLREHQRRVVIHSVITGGQSMADTVLGFTAVADTLPNASVCLWLNDHFGPTVFDGVPVNELPEMSQREAKVLGVVRLQQRNPDTFGVDVREMLQRRLTFTEALSDGGTTIMAKQRLRTVQSDLYEQLDQVAL